MTYYKVKNDKYILRINKKNKIEHYNIIKNELLTQKDIDKINIFDFNNNDFDIVNINKNKTYLFFGIRFEKE